MRCTSLRLTLVALAALSLGVACKKPKPVPEPPPQVVPERVTPPPPPPKAVVDDSETARKAEAEQRMAAMRKAAAAALKDINFDFDKSEIRDADKAKLQGIASFMREYPKVKVLIEGHCDERGTIEYNIALGNRRAAAALSYLKALGVADERLEVVSFGKERPKKMGHEEESWFVNRRCEFKMN